MPVYEEKTKINGKTRYYIRTYITDLQGNCKQVTRRNKNWIGKDGKILAQQEEIKLKLTQNNAIKKDITFKEGVLEFLEYTKPLIKLRTYKKKEDNFRLHIIPYFAKRKISSLTPNDIIIWKNKLTTLTYTKGSITQKYSLAFKKSLYITFCEFMNYCVKNYNINQNVVSIVGNFKKGAGDVKEKEILTEEEFKHAISTETDNIYKDLLTVMFYTGLRIGELGALKKEHIDMEKNVIYIKTTLWQRAPKGENKISSPKTENSIRYVPILKEIKPIFERILKNKVEDEFVFGKERYIPDSNIRRHLHNCIAKAGINKHITPHCLRHSFITMCAEENVPVDITSKIVGHKSISTTYDIYTHVRNKRIMEFESYFNQTRSKQDQNEIIV